MCPGGGYLYCSPREAEPVALSYAAKGFHSFVPQNGACFGQRRSLSQGYSAQPVHRDGSDIACGSFSLKIPLSVGLYGYYSKFRGSLQLNVENIAVDLSQKDDYNKCKIISVSMILKA